MRFSFLFIVLMAALSFAQNDEGTNSSLDNQEVLNTGYGDLYNLEGFNIDQLLRLQEEGRLYFVYHTMDGRLPLKTGGFTALYNIHFTVQNCVAYPLLLRRVRINNNIIAQLLTELYGDAWRGQLTKLPVGVAPLE